MKKRILLLESFPYHFEVLYPQLVYLSDSHQDIYLAVNENIKKDDYFSNVVSKNFFCTFFPNKSKLKNILFLPKFIFWALRTDFDHVVINTAGSIKIYLISLLLKNKTKVSFVVHDADTLQKWYFRFFQKRICNLFVLSNRVGEVAKNKYPDLSSKITYFLPLFENREGEKSVSVMPGRVRICIPGYFDSNKKHYELLFEMLEHGNDKLKNKLIFDMLGNSNTKEGKRFKETVEKKNLNDFFIFYDSYVPSHVFSKKTRNSDCIMPLVSVGENSNGISYGTKKISGAFNLAFNAKKPLLLESRLYEKFEFPEYALYYLNAQHLSGMILTYYENQKTKLRQISKAMTHDIDLSYERQKQTYLKAVSTTEYPA